MIAVDQTQARSKRRSSEYSRLAEKRNTMSKSKTLSAKEVAAMCDMTPKNFRKHLRNLQTFADRKEKRYAFTAKQAEKIVAQLVSEDESVEQAQA